MKRPLTSRAALCAASLLFLFVDASRLNAQVNSINLAGTGSSLQATASSAAIIAGSTATNGGTNSAIIGAANSVVPGGTRFAFIGAGNFNNMAAGSHSAAMIGGFSNTISAGGVRGAIIGGGFNTNAGRSALILGGEFNIVGVSSTGAATVGGISNLVNSNAVGAVVVGGGFNTNAGRSSSILGGELNNIAAANPSNPSTALSPLAATIGGGSGNSIGGDGFVAVVGGGGYNQANGEAATIGGGSDNTISALDTNAAPIGATISGGIYSQVYADYGTVGGGTANVVGGECGSVAGGATNQNHGPFSAIGGGRYNYVTNNSTGSVVAGGLGNEVKATNGIGINLEAAAVISGGANNTASGLRSVIGGGSRNTNSGSHAVIPGGAGNLVTGDSSLAAGSTAKATNASSFVWGDGTTPTISTNDNTFTVRATGGVRFITSTDTGFTGTNDGVVLIPGNGAWSSLSDSNAKTAIEPVSARAILAKLASLPVLAWQYKGRPGRRFIGPMAQDFHAAFGLGNDDKTISTLDSDGVMYAAIQGLVEELKDRDKSIEKLKMKSAEVDALRAQNEELARKIEAIGQRLDSLPPAP